MKVENMNEFKVKFSEVFLVKTSRVFTFRSIKEVSRVKAVRLKEIMFECNQFILRQYYHSSFKWSSIPMSDRVDEVEAALHFDECNLTFCKAKSQSA